MPEGAGPSTLLCTEETVPYRPGENLRQPLRSHTFEPILLQRKGGPVLASGLSPQLPFLGLAVGPAYTMVVGQSPSTNLEPVE